jgi:hypothetical protein
MSHIIKAPSEKFQDKLAKTMAEWMTSIREELGKDVGRTFVKELLETSFEESLGIKLMQDELTSDELNCLHELIEERTQNEWIFGKDLEYWELVNRGRAKTTKVRGGIIVSEATHKAGKLIRATVVLEENVISGLSISGDFFTQPYYGAISGLEKALIGIPLEEEALRSAIKKTFDNLGIVVYGASPEDFLTTILKTKDPNS